VCKKTDYKFPSIWEKTSENCRGWGFFWLTLYVWHLSLC